MVAYVYDEDAEGKNWDTVEIPADLKDEARISS
jgi:hypothetical protein